MPNRLFFVLLSVALLSGCAGTPRTIVPPVHNADLYPDSREIEGLSVAIDPIGDPERQQLYFGRDLAGDGVLPVMVIATNDSDDTFVIRPEDVLVYRGNTIIDPVPPPQRISVPVPFGPTTVQPGSTQQGILFYRTGKKEAGLYGKVERLFSENLTLRLIATDRDSGERITFGPFTIRGW